MATCQHPVAYTVTLKPQATVYQCVNCGEIWEEAPVILG